MEPRAEPQPQPQLQGIDSADYREARELMAKHKWVEAVVVLRSVLRREPARLGASMDLAKALTYSGRREEALTILGQVANLQKGKARRATARRARVLARLFLTQATLQSYQDGLNFMLAQKYRAAQEKFEKALEQEPDNIEILTRLGQSYLLDGDYDSAAERLRLAKRLGAFEPEIRLWLGRAMHQRGELAEAVEELKAARAELMDSELAPVWLAEALFSLGQKSVATEVLEQDIKKQPFHVVTLLTLARFRFQTAGRDTQALWNSRKYLQIATSRLADYATLARPQAKGEGELSLNIRRQPAEIKADIDKLLEQIQDRIEASSAPQT